VDKEIYFKKNNKNPELAGRLTEVVKQVSHSKKWPRFKDENGNWVNSYSLLQDRFFEHMRAAGYTDFERGERGSTAEHLSVLEYKTQQEAARAAALDQKVEKQQQRLSGLQEKISVTKQTAVVFSDISRMGAKNTLRGDVALSPADWKTVSDLAKEGIKSRGIIAGLKEKTAEQLRRAAGLEKKLEGYEGKGISDTMKYYQARRRAPRRLAETVADIMRKPPERQELEKSAPERVGKNYER
jgi:hypothetical protein